MVLASNRPAAPSSGMILLLKLSMVRKQASNVAVLVKPVLNRPIKTIAIAPTNKNQCHMG